MLEKGMKRANQFIIIFVIISFPGFMAAQPKCLCKVKDSIIADYKNFYSLDNLWKLGLGIGYAGFYANTSFDQEIQDFYNDYIKSGTTDDISKIVKPIGNGRITVPVYLTAALVGELTKDTRIGSTVGEWGQRCSRALIVGVPPVLTLQIVLGASRPEEGKDSHWHPFKDNNGVSGHSFMGAVPFLTVAKMTHKRLLKYSFYFGSTLTGLSRINDNKHYFSQVILGWWIAYLSVNSIEKNKVVLAPAVDGIKVMVYF
jgi:membrane-associated phospholipid phosphatase